MRHLKRVLWGIILVAVAVVLALNSLEIIDFDIFFHGWWTLFIIIPSIAGLFEKKHKLDSLWGLAIGVILLLCAQEILTWDMLWKIALPLFIAITGIKMIISSFRKEKAAKIINEIKSNGRNMQSGIAVFCGTEMNFDNAVFDGADLVSVFGDVDCDLRHAIIDSDCVINVVCVFGGIDIKVPDNVKVVSEVAGILGDVEIKHTNSSDAIHTLYIQGVCVFGGVEVV